MFPEFLLQGFSWKDKKVAPLTSYFSFWKSLWVPKRACPYPGWESNGIMKVLDCFLLEDSSGTKGKKSPDLSKESCFWKLWKINNSVFSAELELCLIHFQVKIRYFDPLYSQWQTLKGGREQQKETRILNLEHADGVKVLDYKDRNSGWKFRCGFWVAQWYFQHGDWNWNLSLQGAAPGLWIQIGRKEREFGSSPLESLQRTDRLSYLNRKSLPYGTTSDNHWLSTENSSVWYAQVVFGSN